MRITHLTLSNWRTFASLSVPVAERLIVIGPNASGKSNLLDAVRFVRDLASAGGGLQEAVRSRDGADRLRSLYARQNDGGRVGVSATIADDNGEPWTYSISFRPDSRRENRVLVAEEVVRRGDTELLRRPDADDREDPERLTQTALEQTSANREFRVVADFFSAVRYLHLLPHLMRDAGRSGRAVTDDPFGSDFIAHVNDVPSPTRDVWLRSVTEALRAVVPQFSELQVAVDETGRPHLEGSYSNWPDSDTREDERRMSDGTLRLIGLIWSLMEAGLRGAPVLLEEPDQYLHPAVVRAIPTVLALAQRTDGAQFLLTTHSPEILADDGIRPEEVLVLTPTADGTSGRILAEDENAVQLIRSGLTIAEVALPRTAPPGVDRLSALNLGRR